MFARDVPHVSNVHDTTLMPDDTHSDGVFTHFRSYVATHLDAKFFEHQQSCPGCSKDFFFLKRKEGGSLKKSVHLNDLI